MNPWYYVKDGKQQGPIKKEKLIKLVQEGALSPDTLVWSKGMSGWTEVQKWIVRLMPKKERYKIFSILAGLLLLGVVFMFLVPAAAATLPLVSIGALVAYGKWKWDSRNAKPPPIPDTPQCNKQ